MKIIEIASKVLEGGYVCDHCLGRQFAQLLSGHSNDERGKAMRDMIAMALDSGEKISIDDINFQDYRFRKYKPEKRDAVQCKVCGSIFQRIQEMARPVIESLEEYEFGTMLVGIRLSDELVRKEEALWEECGIEFSESIKNELSRVMGQHLTNELGKDMDRKNPQITVVYDIGDDYFDLGISPVFIYGKYKKFKRGIPQTKWPCSKCRGLGCDACDWTGKQYKETVEELIAEPVLEDSGGNGSKFHGAGREDIDALNLFGREFVLEIKEPMKRTLDLEDLKKRINENNKEKVEVDCLEFCDKSRVVQLKDKKAEKTYMAEVELDASIKQDDLERIGTLAGKTIKQRTPKRVSHRRGDLVRERKVYEISAEYVDEKKIRIKVKGEAGLYIKELVSSDEGRTEPSVAGLLGVGAKVVALDVVSIEDKD